MINLLFSNMEHLVQYIVQSNEIINNSEFTIFIFEKVMLFVKMAI